jgi:single-strand DNA-binding protein
MSLSKIVVSGKVVKAPEKRFTPNTNVAVTEFAIAVASNARPDGSAESTPVKIVTWRDLAERCAQEIKKGDLVTVDGRLQINNYSNSEGQKRRDVEIDAVHVENLSATLGAAPRGKDDYVETPVNEVGAKQTAKVGGRSQSEDLDSIFASEDEIPF